MPLNQVVFSLLALLGHFALWLGAFSRLHAVGLPRRVLNLLDVVFFSALLGVPAMVALGPSELLLIRPLDAPQGMWLGQAYFWLCFGVAVYTALIWCWRAWVGDSAQLLAYDREIVRVVRQLGHRPCGDTSTRLLSLIPGNQILQIEVTEKTVLVPRLPKALDGLTIAHLSDLHFCRHLTRDFFDLVVARTGELEPDLIAVTGDIIDDRQCVPWISDCLGKLSSRYGTFCVFGNHELRIGDTELLVRTVQDAGLNYVGRRWQEVKIHGQSIVVAGNELPWLKPAPDLSDCPRASDKGRPFRMLLSHSPDQLSWARRGDFDLMLAGHTHGGQIRLPIIGALVGESRYGVKYCGSLYFDRPTLLHVSRGLSGCQNLRFNCRPELAKLVLRCGAAEKVADLQYALPPEYLPQPETAVGRSH